MTTQNTTPTARQIVERIKTTLAAAGVAWRAETVDTFKVGDPDGPVTGIATTFMATFDAIKGTTSATSRMRRPPANPKD